MTPALPLVGVDTGGTFTDLVVFVDGELRSQKVLSTPKNPADAVLRGLRELLPEGLPAVVTYGSTVATNALLERRGARVVLITTAGFEDVIEIGRQHRPGLYELEPRRPDPLVPRALRIGVRERVLHDGSVLQPLSPRSLSAALRALQRLKADAVAVCFLHSYANPKHERMVGAALARQPELFCTLSHALTAEHREYERTSTAVINASVGPVMWRHLRELQRRLRGTRLRVMQSNGGAISADVAGREAVRTVLSGPAAGIIGAWNVARALRIRHVITFDMGGTSTDVSLIDGAPRYHTEWTIGGLPIKVPALDIHTVGAGGGSLAHVDAGGALKVGPESAGADPGPACYGKGTIATVTDANVQLGRVVADAFLGGQMQLSPERARRALQRLGRTLRRDADGAAEGIVRVVNASMERAIRTISVERGHDPREYALVAFGGAAGQHACELAAALGIHRVVVPRHPGLLSAWGAAAADVQRDYVRTVRLTNPSAAALRLVFQPLERTARAALRREGVPSARQRIERMIDARYAGQSHEIAVPFSAHFDKAFHDAHRRLYGYVHPDRPIEIVNVRVLAVGRGVRPRQEQFANTVGPAPRAHRVRWAGRWRRAPRYWRPHIAAGRSITGPALIAEFSATTFVPPAWRVTVHSSGHLVLTHAR